MYLEIIKKALPEHLYVEWKEQIKESPIRIKLRQKALKDATVQKWIEAITKLTGETAETPSDGHIVGFWHHAKLMITVYTTGTIMIHGENCGKWLTDNLNLINTLLLDSNAPTNKQTNQLL